MAIYQLGDDAPRIAPTAWVAESAQVIGRVELAEGASVWYGCVLRGDNEWIRIGARSNVQDASVMHTDMGYPLVVGDDVTIGHQVMLHGCIVGDGALIGMQAVVLNGARIGKGCLVAAGAVVPEGKVFEDGWLIIGAPAKAVRPLDPAQMERARSATAHYVDNAQRHRALLRRIG
ncbi:MAG: gamma carbonic anhydrase family protein [Burkholderiales bacterium]|nr:gamma carbonic anhydrase family protein [Burkholderiales bacterium]